MKRISILIAFFLFSITLVKATPQFTSFTVISNYLQNGKIKVYNNGTTDFIAKIGVSRASNGSIFETVNMEVVFYAQIGTTEHDLKTITLTSADFNGAYLAYYNEEPSKPTAANNNVKISLPQNVERSDIRVKYRYKDASNNWIPNTTYGYNTFNTFYQTINVGTPYPSPITISSINQVESILFGTDCGFSHPAWMEIGAWKNVYNINYTKNNPSIADSDIFWEWTVVDPSFIITGEKQFLIYPYGSSLGTPLNGERKVTIEANDYLDEYESKVIVRAVSRSTGAVYSANYEIYVVGVYH